MTEVGTFVTAVPARTEKLAAFPRLGDVAAYAVFVTAGESAIRAMKTSSTAANFIQYFYPLYIINNFFRHVNKPNVKISIQPLHIYVT
jgi:hypothetical protein